MEVGERVLVVQRASVGAKPGQVGSGNSPYEQYPEIPRPILPAGDLSQTSARILLMLNMVTPDDLVDDDEYEERKEREGMEKEKRMDELTRELRKAERKGGIRNTHLLSK